MVEAKRVWVAGEALIDLVPIGTERIPVVGGGPANTAKALANLGIQTSFIGGISTDSFGDLISHTLSNVDLSLALRSSLPTATATLVLDATGSASYEFKLEGSATFDFRGDLLPKGAPDVLYLGTLAAIIEPGASELFDWASRIGAPIIFDPNVRTSVNSDRSAYRQVIERWASISSVIKLSEDDLAWLSYEGVERFLELGVGLVVLTQGASGITAATRSERISVPGVSVEVVDTVGAGDTVGAVITEGLLNYGMDGLAGDNLHKVLQRAARAASITCSRAGAKPPTLAELN